MNGWAWLPAWLATWLPNGGGFDAAPHAPVGAAAAAVRASCPADMALVERDHADEMEHACTDLRGKHCFAYTPGVTTRRGAVDHVRVCMDRYEAPNQLGARPLVMLSGTEAQAWCGAHGKRLCSESTLR